METTTTLLSRLFVAPATMPMLLLLLLLLVSRGRRRTAGCRHCLPPGPPPLPIIGNLHQLGRSPHESLRDLAAKYGPVMSVRLGQVSAVVVSSPAAAEAALRKHDLALADRPPLFAARHLFYGSRDIGFSDYGPYWRQARRICVQELLAAARVASFGGHRRAEAAGLVARVASAAAVGDGVVNLTRELEGYSRGVLCRAAFGNGYDGAGDVHRLLDELQVLMGGFSVGEFFPSHEWLHTVTGVKRRLLHAAAGLDRFLERVVGDHLAARKKDKEERISSEEGRDRVEGLVDVLLDVKEKGGLEEPLSVNDVKAIVLSMLAAGIDSSFLAVDWAMAELFRHPTIMKKLQKEVRDTVGTRSAVSEADLREMTYLKAVLKEVFRVHPPSPILVRQSREDINFEGYEIPARTRFFINVLALGRDPTLWEDPEKFDPERFVSRDDVDVGGKDFGLLPFGSGRRLCPGMAFGTATVEVALAQLLHSFDWELPPGEEPGDIDMTGVFGITMRRAAELKAVAKPVFV